MDFQEHQVWLLTFFVIKRVQFHISFYYYSQGIAGLTGEQGYQGPSGMYSLLLENIESKYD